MEKLLSNGVRSQVVPETYIFPPGKRPGNQVISSKTVPVINLWGTDELHGRNHDEIVEQIMAAGRDFGFFQVVNHGVPQQVINDMMEVAEEFFEMPVEDRAMYYSEDPGKFPRLHTSTGHSIEDIFFWRDCLKLTTYPVGEFMHMWPQKPSKFREALSRYAGEVRRVALYILKLICEALGLEEDYFNGDLSAGRDPMNINYYPPCPDPSLTLGVPAHCDPQLITILLQGNVTGLQVMHDGEWISVEPLPNAFVVNIGHQLEIVTNGKLTSAEHRAVTNSAVSRTSVATFVTPTMDCLISPAQPLVDEQNPPLYKSFLFREFLSAYVAKVGDRESMLEAFKIKVI